MATSTISYFSRRGTTPGKSKNALNRSTVGGQAAAQNYQVTPLFFQETMEANQSSIYRLGTGEDDHDASLSFDQPPDTSIDGNETQRSIVSNLSTGTFRDTYVD